MKKPLEKPKVMREDFAHGYFLQAGKANVRSSDDEQSTSTSTSTTNTIKKESQKRPETSKQKNVTEITPKKKRQNQVPGILG